ncbi:MAG: thiamine diphosphokinase [Clostridia bacterium]|nr:thiamine diphosphokinase [Clostridia bacterium]
MRALIVLGGEAPGRALLERCMRQSDLTIAADRGLAAFDKAGLAPDCLIGDMDSVPQNVLERYTGRLEQTRLNPVKDDTDAEAALHLAVSRGADEITFLGALGGRLDHALANVMLLNRAHQLGARAEILSETVRIARVCGAERLCGAKGDTVSLLPLGRAEGVTLTGFYYPLADHTLTSDTSLGVSNVVVSNEARIEAAAGDLILFHYYAGDLQEFDR